ncbi:DUF676-domain-containing protein [Flagelloscypha sp. PMI_526]|nr:DUF676-domain-containing protein [Flagelloscypha sp. PMI_526]
MTDIHLLVLIHGMWGNPGHLNELERKIREVYSHSGSEDNDTKLDILVPGTIRDDSTYDGIDWGGERVVLEIYAEMEKLEKSSDKVTRFSVTGYSWGGLVARYVIGVLYHKNFFASITAVNFNTIATPHLGFPRFPSFMSGIFSSLGPKLLSRTGEQCWCTDKWSDHDKPLLLVMSDPEFLFYQALALFQTRRIYANAINDVIVPFVTAAIETYDPFLDAQAKELDLVFDSEYKHLLKSFSPHEGPATHQVESRDISSGWWTRAKSRLPPPPVQLMFPLDLLFYLSLPVLLPIGASLVMARFCIASYGSKSRVKLLESNNVEIEDSTTHPLALTSFPPCVRVLEGDNTPSTWEPASKHQPLLTPTQLAIARNLNTLEIEKKVVYLEDASAHGMIMMRDAKRVSKHKQGEGVVRHWADSFVL